MKRINYLLIPVAFALMVSSCKKSKEEEATPAPTPTPSSTTHALGYSATDNPSTIPSAINFGTATGTLPSSYSIIDKFPPIGNQGQYGTCVAWATAYNTKTALEGMDNGWGAAQLSDVNNQLSPLDLFTSIDNSLKGQNCNGTNFTSALDVVLNRGVATLAVAPYNNLTDCSTANVQTSWTANAGSHKIKNYRKIPKTVVDIKTAIADNIPVIFGAKLSDNFMTWNNDNVISANTTYNQVGQHAGHALVVSGYDDNKGPNGAFRVTNSWGTNWGDAGYIWVDYNFFVNEFVPDDDVFTATNDHGNGPPPPVDPSVTSNPDLAAWATSDVSMGGTDRQITFDIYNIGAQNAPSAQGWNVSYLYYNAYDANDYGFLFYDDMNTTVPLNTLTFTSNGFVANYDVPSGTTLAQALFASNFGMYQNYSVPGSVTGYYYLILIADTYNSFDEEDEQNNYFYTSGQYPITFINGVVQRSAKPVNYIGNYSFKNRLTANKTTLKNNPYRSVVNSTYPNAYGIDEIRQMIKNQKKSGEWNRKLQAFKLGKQTVVGGINK